MANLSEAWLLCRNQHHRDPWTSEPPTPQNRIPVPAPQSQTEGQTPPASAPTADLQRRLDNANAYFRRKAAEVLTDDSAVRLMAVLYQDGLVELADFNKRQLGLPLAKIAAAGFCEIGANAICITQSGQNFIGSLIPFVPATDAASHRTTPTQTADNAL